MNKKIRTDIILPNRIGDSILTIPALVCLKQLINKFDKDTYHIKIISSKVMNNFFTYLNLFQTEKLDNLSKLKTWINTPDKAFFYLNSSQILGYRAKCTYGQNSDTKKYIKYDIDIPYVVERTLDRFPDKNLLNLLKEKYSFSNVIINNFSLCLALGYTYQQIEEVFDFDSTIFAAPSYEDKYFICCMEAAYGKKRSSERRWSVESFIDIAEYLYTKHKIKTAFVGIDPSTPIPSKSYFGDYRGKVDILDLMKLIENSCGYIGNDTGPLHMSNLIGKPTLGVYTVEVPEVYGPIFASNNYPVQNPSSASELFPIVDKIVENLKSK